MRDGNLTIIASRPGQGKTALLVTIALNNAKDKRRRGISGKVLFLSMEMTVEELTARFLSQISEVPAERILDGKMTPEEWDKYNDAVGVFEDLPIVINDVPALTINQIRNEAQMHLRDGEENILIVDYLQLATSGQNKINRVDEVGMVARGLKVYAGEKKTPVLAAAQLSRAIETRSEKRPILSDLRESGNIEQDANNVLFLHCEDDIAASSKGVQEIKKIIVAKQRNGATSATKGDISVRWNAPIMRFENISFCVRELA
jgi:replicative DNA helicase